MGKKPFVNRKEASHFYLAHRSQRDPLINDEDASQRVLQEVAPSNMRKHKAKKEAAAIEKKPARLTQDEIDQVVGQAALHGVFFDDAEYNYMQHLRPIGNEGAVMLEAPAVKEKEKKKPIESMIKDNSTTKAELPAEALPSTVEMNIGLMNQPTGLEGGLQPDMDPRLREVLEALEDEEYVEGELDGFFDELNADGDAYVPGEDDEEEEEEEEGEEGDMEGTGYDWQSAFKNFKRGQHNSESDDEFDDRRSKGTGFSVSSSAMHRNAQLTLLDDRFDKVEEEYMRDDESSDGEAHAERQDFDAILDDFLDKYEIVGNKMKPKLEGSTADEKLQTIRNALRATHIDDSETDEDASSRRKQAADESHLWERPVVKRETWDCQSVLSTYSNLENHPKLISDRGLPKKKISIDPKTGMPVLVQVEQKKSAAGTQPIDESVSDESSSEEEDQPRLNLGVSREKHETKEEKKARKQAVKESRKNRREEKKNTQLAFKTEEGRQRQVLSQQKKTKGVKHIP